MKRISALIMILALLVMPFAAQATSLSDLGDKPEPEPRTMPEPCVTFIPKYSNGNTEKFLGKVVLPNDATGLGYEYSGFSSERWEQTQSLINYDNRLIQAGYGSPNMSAFEGENQQYLCFSGSDKPSIWLLPYLKENALIVIIRYSDAILDAFPEDVSAEEAYSALVAQLDDEDTRDSAAEMLSTIWKTSAMTQEVADRITAENMFDLIPALIRKDYYTRFNDDGEVNASKSVTAIGEVLRTAIGAQETADDKLSLAARVARDIVPAVDERYLQYTSLVWNSSDMKSIDVTQAMPAIPAFDKEVSTPDDLADDGAAHKYVIVCEYDGNYSLMPYHAVFLPVDEIAQSIEEADRIIVCHNYYKKSSGNWIGGTPSDSITRINLYNAADGSLICKVGAAGNYQGMISHGGIPHDWIEMGEVIRDYFANK